MDWKMKPAAAWSILALCSVTVWSTARTALSDHPERLMGISSNRRGLPLIAYGAAALVVGILMIIVLVFAKRVPRRTEEAVERPEED